MEGMKEQWKLYKYHGLQYKISNFGGIIGLSRNKPLKKRLNPDGYITVTIGNNELGRSSVTLHRLVAILFVPNQNPKECTEVNHKDYDRTNCRFDNLEWVTHIGNIHYSSEAKRYNKPYGKDNPNYGNHILSKRYKENPQLAKEKLSRPGKMNGRAKKIKMFDKNKKYLRTFDYIGQCAKYLIEQGMTKNKINSIRNMISKSIKDGSTYMNRYFEYVQ